jgi:predicted 2-oxoglutarate/Fe(II)-dependent dioxygenase YbiX
LRTLAVFPFDHQTPDHVSQLMRFLDQLPRAEPFSPATNHAPVLVVPRIFEPEHCRRLIELYRQNGGEDSGFMREVDGQTVRMFDYGHKRRRDFHIKDDAVCQSCMVRIHDRLVPEIHKAFQFRATRMERYMVGCYDSATKCHFNSHRDNTTKGTAHRRFAVTINLNPEEYEGGDVWFPEFGTQLYRAPLGGALVFSCSLLHEVTKITRGQRYAFLPFLYDDEAARIRQENKRFVAKHADNQQT